MPNTRKKKRAAVIGLDGVPYSLIRQFSEDGTMPFLSRLVKSGSLARMKVTLPEISAVSWPSFMTGANPGVHGIFGFMELGEGYRLRFPGFPDLKCPTFWDKLGERGKRAVVINQPGTYPARPIPGVLISGFVAIDLVKAVQPLRWLAALRRLNYEIDIDTQRCRKDHDQLFLELERTLQARQAALEMLWSEAEWDYFQVVITGTDRLQHYLWSAVEDSSHPRHGQALAYYRKVDAFLRQRWEDFHAAADVSAEGEGFFLLSDHGFCGIRQEVYLNAWLRRQGYLKFEKDPPQGLADISEEAAAFALDPGRIYLHLRGKYPKGRLREEEASRLKKEIKEKLADLCYHDEKIMEAVKEREEIYSGPETVHGPDLVAVPRHGFDLKGQPDAREVFGKSDLTGMHTWDDAFFWSTNPAPPDLEITRLAEIVCADLK